MIEQLRGRVSKLLIASALAWCVPGCDQEEVDAADEDTGAEPDPLDPCKPGPSPSLEIGQGELKYEILEDGGELELIHGPQGGIHTLTGLLARDIDGSQEITGELRGYLDGEQVGGSWPYLDFRCAVDEGSQVWGVFLFWDIPAEDLHMRTVRIEAEFTDPGGTLVQASKEAVIHDPTL